MDANRQMGALKILLTDNIKPMIIDGMIFEMNLDDPEVYKALLDFKIKYTDYHLINSDDDFNIDKVLDECEKTIDIILGKGTCEKLFTKKTMKMYLLVNELANIYQENFMKEEQEKEKEKLAEEVQNLEKIMDGMNSLARMMTYADNRYGNKGNRYVPNRKSSKKHKHRK